MAAARCPVCNDIISVGIAVKLYQTMICPTCLTSLQVVSLSPLEIELPRGGNNSSPYRVNRSNHKKKNRPGKAVAISQDYYDDDEFQELDDYTLERQLRHKSERNKYKKDQIRPK
jgi:hypothetical protein